MPRPHRRAACDRVHLVSSSQLHRARGESTEMFAAKVDLWFLGLFYGFGVFMLVAGPLVRKRPQGRFAAALLPILGLLFLGVGWTVSQVRYEITETGYLDAHGWPYAGRITHVSEIEKIEASRDPRASHAASLDRLRIDFADRRLIFIAVVDKQGFLDAIAARDPGLVRTKAGVLRSNR